MRTIYNYIVNFIRVFKIRRSIKNKRASIDDLIKDKFNFIGSSKRKHPGLKLYSFNPITEEITEVPVINQSEGNSRGFIDPDSILLWSINYNNAKRKFLRNHVVA